MPRVLFLADQFSDTTRTANDAHPGGAELTDAAAIEACPWPIECATPANFDLDRLADFDVHIIGNFETAPAALIKSLARLGRHILFEHDVRICQWNGNFPASWEKMHRNAQWCTCPHPKFATLYRSALATIFLTHRQLAVYQANPFFSPRRAFVLGSSLMNEAFFEQVARTRAQNGLASDPAPRPIDWAVVYSRNAIKGFEAARDYCLRQGAEPFVIRDKSPQQVLEILAKTDKFVYLPQGLEPAGRLLLEARFLGARIISNPNAGVAGESWWNLNDADALAVVRDAPHRFWRIVRASLLENPNPSENRSSKHKPVVHTKMHPGWQLTAPVSNIALRLLEAGVPKAVFKRMTRQIRERAQDVADISRTGHDVDAF